MNKKKITERNTLVRLSHKVYADKELYEKVHLHLRDINDTISEDDIKTVGSDMIVAKIPEATRLEQFNEARNAYAR